MNSPLIMHLCASQIEMGDKEGSIFSLKYVCKTQERFLVISLSVSNKASSRHVLVYVVLAGKVKDRVTGLWSNTIEGSMVEIVIRCRSDFDKKR